MQLKKNMNSKLTGKLFKYISFVSALFFLAPMAAHGQLEQNLFDFLSTNMNCVSIDRLPNDTIREQKWVFVMPKKSDDFLVSRIRKDLREDVKRFEDFCGKKGDLKVEYEIKTYIQGVIISIVENTFFDCASLSSPQNSSTTYNYVIYKKQLYKIALSQNNSNLQSAVKLAINEKFDKDCLEYEDIGNNFDLFIQRGFFINNPLNSKVCSDVIELTDVKRFLTFLKIEGAQALQGNRKISKKRH
jgi:hypothetical protein